jgi:hypothetical protein
VVPRYLRGYGLIETPLAHCLLRLGGAHLGGRSVLRPHDGGRLRPASMGTAVAYLDRLTHPATRWVLFALTDRWTAVINNLRDGSDFADDAVLVARLCQTRVCRVVDYLPSRPSQVGAYLVRDGHPARIFELYDADGASLRSIAAMLDGDRWVFETSGEPLAVEDGFDYTARRKRDRFTADNLFTLLASLDVNRPVPAAFATTEEFFLLDAIPGNREWAAQVEARACTTAQADDPGYGYLQRGLGWTAHLQTHASSVVWDMTRAVLLSPHLHDQARGHLDAARRQLGDREYHHLAAQAEEHLRRHGG